MLIGQGSGRNGDHYLFRPAGVPAAASMFVDFVAQRAWRGLVAPVEFDDMFSCTRSTIAYAQRSDGIWEEFAIDEPRLTDLGLLVEPARSGNLLWSMDLSVAASWPAEGLTRSVGEGQPISGQTPTRFTWTTGNGRFAQSFVATAPTPYVMQAIVRGTAAARYAYFRSMLMDVGVGYNNAVFDLTAGVVGYLAPSYTSSRMTSLGDGWWLIEAEGVSSVAANRNNYLSVVNVPVTGNGFFSPTAGMDYFDVAYFNILTGAGRGTPVRSGATVTTRAADVVAFPLPAGTHDQTFTFRDGGTQVATGQSGTPSMPAQTQPRTLRSMTAVAA
jgi:hypothetical protein